MSLGFYDPYLPCKNKTKYLFEGWRDGSAFKSAVCSSRGPSSLTVICTSCSRGPSVLVSWAPGTQVAHRRMFRQNTHTHKSESCLKPILKPINGVGGKVAMKLCVSPDLASLPWMLPDKLEAGYCPTHPVPFPALLQANLECTPPSLLQDPSHVWSHEHNSHSYRHIPALNNLFSLYR